MEQIKAEGQERRGEEKRERKGEMEEERREWGEGRREEILISYHVREGGF